MTEDKEQFLARLDWLLGGRKRSPWAQALGFSGGTLTRLGSPTKPIPGPTELRAIMWSENVSLNWLCEGIGPKFMMTATKRSEEFYRFVTDELGDDFTQINLFHDGSGNAAIVFSRPATRVYKGETHYRYDAINLITGELSGKLEHALSPFAQEVATYRIASDVLLEIEEGEYGTYRLQQLAEHTERDAFENVFAPVTESDMNAKYLRLAIEMVEQAIADDGSHLDAKQKSRVVLAIYEHCQSHRVELTQDLVKLLIDAAA